MKPSTVFSRKTTMHNGVAEELTEDFLRPPLSIRAWIASHSPKHSFLITNNLPPLHLNLIQHCTESKNQHFRQVVSQQVVFRHLLKFFANPAFPNANHLQRVVWQQVVIRHQLKFSAKVVFPFAGHVSRLYLNLTRTCEKLPWILSRGRGVCFGLSIRRSSMNVIEQSSRGALANLLRQLLTRHYRLDNPLTSKLVMAFESRSLPNLPLRSTPLPARVALRGSGSHLHWPTDTIEVSGPLDAQTKTITQAHRARRYFHRFHIRLCTRVRCIGIRNDPSCIGD
jgi:hypothetical protein